MSTILEMQIDELQEENAALKAINQKIQLEKNALKKQLALYGVSQQRELLKAFLEHIEYTVDFLPCEPSVLIDDYLNSL